MELDNRLYYQVAAWMINDLHLKGNELKCYAVIYSLSQLGQGMYNAGLDFLAKFMQVSQPTVSSAIDSLFKKGLIDKSSVITETGRRVLYFCKDGNNKNLMDGDNKKFLEGVHKNFMVPNKYNIIENKNKSKSVSNDTQKEDELFTIFWDKYGYKKGKENAKKAWRKLNDKEKDLAIKAIDEYKEDCRRNQRQMKHPTTYLNQKTWNDDFTNDGKLNNLCYDVDPEDDDVVRRFKEWMRRKHPEIEFTEKPLTFEGYMRLQDAYGMDEVCDQLDYIDANIGKYRQCDIEAIIRRYFERQ